MPEAGIDSRDLQRAIQVMRRYPALAAPVVRRFLFRVAEMQLNDQRVHSPVKDGRTRTSLGRGAAGAIWRLAGALIEWSLEIGTAVTHSGVSYPEVLDLSGRHRYARGSFAGSLTQGWFSRSRERTTQQIVTATATAGRELISSLSRQLP